MFSANQLRVTIVYRWLLQICKVTARVKTRGSVSEEAEHVSVSCDWQVGEFTVCCGVCSISASLTGYFLSLSSSTSLTLIIVYLRLDGTETVQVTPLRRTLASSLLRNTNVLVAISRGMRASSQSAVASAAFLRLSQVTYFLSFSSSTSLIFGQPCNRF